MEAGIEAGSGLVSGGVSISSAILNEKIKGMGRGGKRKNGK